MSTAWTGGSSRCGSSTRTWITRHTSPSTTRTSTPRACGCCGSARACAAEHGRPAVGPLYEALGARLFDTPRDSLSASDLGTRQLLEPLLRDAGLPTDLADALDDTALDDEIRAETEEALALTGRDVGTPILHFQPPGGTAFFGPVISRLPSPDDAGRLWDHVIGLAAFAGFAEIKRSLRERPQLASFGVDEESVGIEEDWHGGSRRTKK